MNFTQNPWICQDAFGILAEARPHKGVGLVTARPTSCFSRKFAAPLLRLEGLERNGRPVPYGQEIVGGGAHDAPCHISKRNTGRPGAGPYGWARQVNAVGRQPQMPPGCEAAHRLRQQTIQPRFVFGTTLDLPAANALVPSAPTVGTDGGRETRPLRAAPWRTLCAATGG